MIGNRRNSTTSSHNRKCRSLYLSLYVCVLLVLCIGTIRRFDEILATSSRATTLQVNDSWVLFSDWKIKDTNNNVVRASSTLNATALAEKTTRTSSQRNKLEEEEEEEPPSSGEGPRRETSRFALPQSTTHQADNRQQAQRVMMVSYVFGKEAVSKQYLRVFVESAERSGIDVALVGDHPPAFKLPSNVRHVLVTWDDMVDRVRDRILGGKEPGSNLREVKSFYKVVDFKPLFAHLFPEQVEGYDWWGHLDNDMVLGNLRQFFNQEKLSQYDIISGIPNEYTWGPFTLYRNIPLVNELFRHSERPLSEIFATDKVRVFDEWGGGFDRTQGQHYYSTMAGIVDRHRERLGLRWYGGMQIVWDGHCQGKKDGVCSECMLIRPPGGRKQRLVQNCFGRKPCSKRVSICHFEFSKEAMEKSLVDDTTASQLLQQPRFRISFREGFVPVQQ